MRVFVLSLLVVLVFVFGIGIGDRLSTYKHKAVILKLQGEANIYKGETERLTRALKAIQETAVQATAAQKAQ